MALPDVELLLTTFLRQDTLVTNKTGDEIYTELPANFNAWPGVRVTRVGGAPAFRPLVLDKPLVQFDIWGGPKRTALSIAEEIRDALDRRLPFKVQGVGVLGGVERFGSLRYFPDDTYSPARPRWIFDAVLITRP